MFLPMRFTSPLVVAEIGAGGRPSPRWGQVCPDYAVVLAEADPRAAGFPPATARTVITGALLDREGETRFHLSAAQPLSSVYEPDIPLLEGLLEPDLVRNFHVEETRTIACDTLDNQLRRSGIADIDVLKVDVEGAELAVLHGASGALGRAIAVEVEVAFLPVRKNQPVFAMVDAFLTGAGYRLWDIEKSYFLRKGTADYGRIKGQSIFGIALYFVPPELLVERDHLSPRKIPAACYAYLAYGYYDAAETLLRLAKEHGIIVAGDEQIRVLLRQQQGRIKMPDFKGRAKLHRLLARLTRALGPEGKNLIDPGIGNRF